MNWRENYLRRYYTSRPGWRDGSAEFLAMIDRYLRPGKNVLELGCGVANAVTEYLHDRAGAVDGLDVDPEARSNHFCREVFLYDGGDWPIGDETYDAVVSNYVLEHVADPDRLAGQLRRVLRPGGLFLFRTPCRWHYVSVVARLTPQWVHDRLAHRLLALEPGSPDRFPTYYRMNTQGRLVDLLARHGLDPLDVTLIEKEPAYGMAHPLLFLGFMLYERLVNSAEEYRGLRANILGAFVRQET